MELSKKQKAFLDFIPISQMRKTVLQSYSLLLFFIPFLIDYYYSEMVDGGYKLWNFVLIVILIDSVLVIISILVLIRPKIFFAVFHLFLGATFVYTSIMCFIAFWIEACLVLNMSSINILFLLIIYLVAVFIINFTIVRMNFSKYPKSSNKISPILVLAPIIGMIAYNLVGNTFKINGMAIAMYLLAIAMGLSIHSLYRGYLILKYKYKPSDL